MSGPVVEANPDPTSTSEVGAPERQVVIDLARRWFVIGPLLALVSTLIWGFAGLWSSLLALGLVMLNFLIGAAAIGYAAKISLKAIGPAVLGGYLLRLGLLAAVVLPIRSQGWFEPLPFGIVLLVTHLGLLLWELRHVSATLAYPGLKPSSLGRRGLLGASSAGAAEGAPADASGVETARGE